MEIYKKLPSDLQRIVDRKIHEINFYETLEQFVLPTRECDICGIEDESMDIYNPGWIELCKACVQPCHRKMLTVTESMVINIFRTGFKPSFFDQFD